MSRDWESFAGVLCDEERPSHVEARHYPEPPSAFDVHTEAQALKDEKRREGRAA